MSVLVLMRVCMFSLSCSVLVSVCVGEMVLVLVFRVLVLVMVESFHIGSTIHDCWKRGRMKGCKTGWVGMDEFVRIYTFTTLIISTTDYLLVHDKNNINE